jgi:ADP-ribosylglycohydrolase
MSIQERKEASIMLSSYFETLGYYNGKWEFNYGFGPIIAMENAMNMWLKIIFEYNAMGGRDLNIKSWNASDDTLLLLSTIKDIESGGILWKGLLNYEKELTDEKRAAGTATLIGITRLKNPKNIKNNTVMIQYNESSGGNAPAVRCIPLGLKFTNRDKIIIEALGTSLVTHTHALGYLGGIASALFASYAIKKISPWQWLDLLLKEEHPIDVLMEEHDDLFHYYVDEKRAFWKKIRHYKEVRLPQFGKASFKDAKFRMGFFIENYSYVKNEGGKDRWDKLGASGIDCLLLAYEALLSGYNVDNGNWQKVDFNEINLDSIIFFGVLHFGDNDSTAALVGAWYGALYGYKNFNKEKTKELEFYKELLSASKYI